MTALARLVLGERAGVKIVVYLALIEKENIVRVAFALRLVARMITLLVTFDGFTRFDLES